MKGKKFLNKFALMASIMGMTTLLAPRIYYAEEKALLQAGEIKGQKTAYDYNKEAIDFINYIDKEKLKVWDNPWIRMTESEAKEIKTFMEKNIIKEEKDDYKKAKLIYDWIWQNVKYGSDHTQKIGLTPYEVFKLKYAVCGGYSNLYKAMLNLANIPSVIVTGDTSAGGHAWNLVYANNRWFYSDSTWGLPSGRYFDNDAKVSSYDHTATNLSSVTISNGDGLLLGFNKGVSVVGLDKNITSVVIPEKYKDLDITSVSYDLFKGKYNVQHIYLSDKIEELEIQPSSNKLKSFEVSENNKKYASKDGVLYTKDFSKILVYPAEKDSADFTIPKETNWYDSKETFANRYLKNINVEEGNKNFSFYDGAVYNYDKTQLLTIPEGKESITISEKVKLDNVALSFKENLKTVRLNEGITEIPAYTFNGSTSLREIYIPNTVTKIDNYAFENVNLNSLKIYGEKSSYAEKYAKDNRIQFVSTSLQGKIENLKALVDKGYKIDTNGYTDESISILKSELNNAESILSNKDILEEKVEAAINNLDNAITNLKVKEVEKTEDKKDEGEKDKEKEPKKEAEIKKEEIKPVTKRVYGNNRYETSYKLFDKGWASAETVVLASGVAYPDALTATPLASKYNAPILLAKNTSLTSQPELKATLTNKGVKNVIIVGGEVAIPKILQDEISSLGIKVRRIGGSDRYETSALIAKEVGVKNGEVALAYGLSFADGLSIASIAGKKQIPILLTKKDSIPDSTKNFLNSNNINKTYIIGGTGVISTSVSAETKNPERLGGSNRYETNSLIFNRFKSEIKLDSIYIASGLDFPDALSSSALAAKNSNFVLLSNTRAVENSVKNIISIIKPSLTNTYVIGGNVIIKDDILLGLGIDKIN